MMPPSTWLAPSSKFEAAMDRDFNRRPYFKGRVHFVRPDLSPPPSPNGYRLEWIGRLTRKKTGELEWDGVFIGHVVKIFNKWVAISVETKLKLVCPTCSEPTLTPLHSGCGFRCKHSENVYRDGKWSHNPVWMNIKTWPTRDQAIESLIPRGR